MPNEKDISDILYDVWDPLNVKRFDAPKDEYALYVPEIILKLKSHISAADLAEYLNNICISNMEASVDHETNMRTAIALIQAP